MIDPKEQARQEEFRNSLFDWVMEVESKHRFWNWARCYEVNRQLLELYLLSPRIYEPMEHWARHEAVAMPRSLMNYWIQFTGYKIT